jgi:hypothetical protein
MCNISFIFKVPYVDKEPHNGKICFSNMDNFDKNKNNIKKFVLTGINLYRYYLGIPGIKNVDIGILGTDTGIDTDTDLILDNEYILFDLYIKYNNNTSDYDYYYSGKLLK